MISVPAFIFVLGVLIFVHELGHYLAAKSVGIGVHRFSIGLGPATPLKFTRGETEYLIAWIPFGGYVKMASKEEQEQMEMLEGGAGTRVFPQEKLFENKPLWARIWVISAGVIMNMLFAWVTFFGLALAYGVSEDVTTQLARVDAQTLPAGATELAELPFGADILAINGEEVQSRDDILKAVLDAPAGLLNIVFEDHPTVEVEVTSEADNLAIAQSMVPLWAARIGGIVPASVAEKAGLEEGDLILSIDDKEIRSWDDMVDVLQSSAGVALSLDVERDGTVQKMTVTPKEEKIQDPQSGETRRVGRVGIVPQVDTRKVPVSLGEAFQLGNQRTWGATFQIVDTLKGMVQGLISPRELGGPLAIGQMAGQAARAGLEVLLMFTALLSVNLAVLNLLPIPALDGGHLVFLILEGIRGGKPVSLEWRLQALKVGVLMLLGLMVFVFGNDILRLFGI